MSTAQVTLPTQPFEVKHGVRADLRELWQYRSLVWQLFTSGLQTERTGTVFGFLWWLLDPIFLMFVYLFLFDIVWHRSEPDFPLYILVSLICWEFFLKSVERSIAMTIGAADSMKQVRYPKSVIPIAVTFTEYTHLLFGMLVAVVVAKIGFGIEPTPKLLLLIPLSIVQLMFTLGFAFLLSGTNFFFRDVSHLLRYFMRAWYLLSPGLFTLARIPPAYRGVYQLDPFAPFFESYHVLVMPFLGDLPALGGPPDWALFYVVALSVVTLVGSYALYVRLSPNFVKLVD